MHALFNYRDTIEYYVTSGRKGPFFSYQEPCVKPLFGCWWYLWMFDSNHYIGSRSKSMSRVYH